MTLDVTDKHAAFGGHDPSLADLRRFILADQDLSEGRRKAMASAINTVARALKKPPEAISANPVALRPMLSAITPAMARLSYRSWANARSLLAAALDRFHGGIIPGRIDAKPSAAWQGCLSLLPANAPERFQIVRFARYATMQRIEPDAIDDAVLDRYEKDLRCNSLASEPARARRDTARFWNSVAERFLNWPQQLLTVPDNRVRFSLPWSSYPPSLLKEIDHCVDRLGRDPLAERDFRALRPASIGAHLRNFALYLGALVASGQQPETMTSLSSVISVGQINTALRHILARNSNEITVGLSQIARTALMLAKHEVRLSGPDIERITRQVRQTRINQFGLAERNETRLAQLNEKGVVEKMLNAPKVIAAAVLRAGQPTTQLAQQYQTAVVLELAIMTALRISNIAGLEIGRSIILRHDGGVEIRIPKTEVKNNVSINVDLPKDSADMVRNYITCYRNLLADPNSTWFFPGNKPGTQKTTDAIRSQSMRVLARQFGIAWNPHLFRHLLAHLQLENDPGADGVVTRALGHKSADTARRHYSGFQTAAAIRQHDELVQRRRASGPVPPKGGRR
jgi:integrase